MWSCKQLRIVTAAALSWAVGRVLTLDCTGFVAGLMTLGAALAFGATNVTITDISPQNLDLAKQMGATHTYNHSRTAKPEVRAHMWMPGVKQPPSEQVTVNGELEDGS